MKIDNVEVLAGETKRIDVNIALLPSHSPIGLNIIVSRSKNPGPTLLLTGGLHGDEVNGIEIVRRIIEYGYNVPECGTIICIPIINVYGFIHFSRYVPDGKDVNRSFPGNKSGSLASRVASFLMKEIIPKIDYGIDFHTGGADRTNYPQIRCLMTDPVNAKFADIFNAPFTLNSKFRSQSFRQSAAKIGKKILVYEGGESARFDEFAIKTGIEGTMRLMKHLGMSNRDTLSSTKNLFIKKSSWIRSKASGLFQPTVNCGQAVTKNQVVGHLTDPYGSFKVSIRSILEGYVIGINNNPILHQGDAVIHIGVV